MSRSKGKGMDVVLALGGAGLLAGFALLMTLVGPRGRHLQSCAELGEFLVPRLELVDQNLDTHMGAWPDSAEDVSEIYSALAKDLRNGRLLSLSDGEVRDDSHRLARAADLVGERARMRNGTLESTEKLERAVADFERAAQLAGGRCR